MNNYDNWQEEKRSAYLYAIIAENEKNILHQKLFSDLQHAAEKQATKWENKIHNEGLPPPTLFSPDWRTRLIMRLIKYFGVEYMHPILSAMKIRGMSLFTRYHSEHRHTSLSSANNLRAAIFGINDGLISNMSLILGLAGAHTNPHVITVAGVAGLLAGASSIGAL